MQGQELWELEKLWEKDTYHEYHDAKTELYHGGEVGREISSSQRAEEEKVG